MSVDGLEGAGVWEVDAEGGSVGEVELSDTSGRLLFCELGVPVAVAVAVPGVEVPVAGPSSLMRILRAWSNMSCVRTPSTRTAMAD